MWLRGYENHIGKEIEYWPTYALLLLYEVRIELNAPATHVNDEIRISYAYKPQVASSIKEILALSLSIPFHVYI